MYICIYIDSILKQDTTAALVITSQMIMCAVFGYIKNTRSGKVYNRGNTGIYLLSAGKKLKHKHESIF